MTRQPLFALCVLVALAFATRSFAHCQIPCGIYDDEMRFAMMREHVNTIAKSMRNIESLGTEEKRDHNQIARWVMNKEAHADELTQIATYYFLAQRVKLPNEKDPNEVRKYRQMLSHLHEIVLYAMKAKQTINTDHCENLRQAITAFEAEYLGPKAAAHGHDHTP